MANLSKKWGTVIGCWCVALVLIVTGICLGLVIPSSAAEDTDEGDIAVMFDADGDGEISDGETTVYHQMQKAITAAQACAATEENPVTVKLQSNVSTPTGVRADFTVGVIIDLNGNYWRTIVNEEDKRGTIDLVVSTGGSLTITDNSDNSIDRYVRCVNGQYEFSLINEIGKEGTLVKGGIIAARNLYVTAGNGGKIKLASGTYVADDDGILSSQGITANVTIEEGVTWQAYMSSEDYFGFSLVAVSAYLGGTVTINGGTIYGEVICSHPAVYDWIEQVNAGSYAEDQMEDYLADNNLTVDDFASTVRVDFNDPQITSKAVKLTAISRCKKALTKTA